MALSDGHALLVYSTTHADQVRAFDFNGNQITLSDRERDVLRRGQNPDALDARAIIKPITIYGGWAYYPSSRGNAWANDRLLLLDLNQFTDRTEYAFPSTREKATKLMTVDDANGRLVAAHWEFGGNRATDGDTRQEAGRTGEKYLRVREYGLPAEVNYSGFHGRPMVTIPASAGFLRGYLEDQWDGFRVEERRIFLSDNHIYLWLPTARTGIGYGSSFTGEEECWVVNIAPHSTQYIEYAGERRDRGFLVYDVNSNNTIRAVRGVHDPKDRRVAGKFAVSSDQFFALKSNQLWHGFGFSDFDTGDTNSAHYVGTFNAAARLFATRWHLWAHIATHQIFRYPLSIRSNADITNGRRTINAYPAGHTIDDLVAYRNHLYDFRDAPLGVTTAQPDPGAPPVPALIDPSLPASVNVNIDLTLMWAFDRVFGDQWIRRRLVTDPGETTETLGAWQYWDGAAWQAEAVTTRDARRRLEGDDVNGISERYTFDAGEFGDGDATYEIAWRFTDLDTLKTSPWSADGQRITVTSGDVVAAPEWRFDGEPHGHEPVDVLVTIPAGQTADTIIIERSPTSFRLPQDRSWWSAAADSWVTSESDGQAAKVQVGMTGEQRITLAHEWQGYDMTTYWRVSYRRANAISRWSMLRAVTTPPELRAEPCQITAPLDGSLLTTREPLVFRGVCPVDERTDLLWLLRRAVGGTTWQWWHRNGLWVDGEPDLRQGWLDRDFDPPSFDLWSQRRHRTEFEISLPAGWANQGERWAYSVQYVGVNGWGSRRSNEVVVTGSTYLSPLAQQGTVLLKRVDADGVVTFEARDWQGREIDLPATHLAAFTAYGNSLPEAIYGDDGYWLTLTGYDRRNLNTGETVEVMSPSNTVYAQLLIHQDRRYVLNRIWDGTAHYWGLSSVSLVGGAPRGHGGASSAAIAASPAATAINNTLEAPYPKWMTANDRRIYIGGFAINTESLNASLLTTNVQADVQADFNGLTGVRNFDADGDNFFFTSTTNTTPAAPPVMLYSTRSNQPGNFTNALSTVTTSPDATDGVVGVTDTLVSSGTEFASIRVRGGQVFAKDHTGGNAGVFLIRSIAPGGINDALDDYAQPAHAFGSHVGPDEVLDFEIYEPPGWSYSQHERSFTLTLPRPWRARGSPLHRNPEEPLALTWLNGNIDYTHIAIAVRERGEDDWLYFDARGRQVAVEQALPAQPAGSVLDALERANGYLMPAGWGEDGTHYEMRLRYKAASGGWSPYGDIFDVRARIRVTADIPPPRIIQPVAGGAVDGTLPYEIIVEIPDGFVPNYVMLRRLNAGRYEYWQAEVEGVYPLARTAGWRSEAEGGGIAWERSGRRPTSQIAIPMPRDWQALDTTSFYDVLMVTSRATDGRSSPWSAQHGIASVAGATQRSIAFVSDRPEAPTWISRSGGYDGAAATTLRWRFHPRLAGQVQHSYRIARRPLDDDSDDAIEWYGGGFVDEPDFVADRTSTTSTSSEVDLRAGWQANGETWRYAVQTRAEADGEWSAMSADLIVVAGAAEVTITTPLDGATVGQMPRVDWATDDPQVAYQLIAYRAGSQPVIYDSGWVLGDARHAVAQLPQSISSGTLDLRVRIRDSYDRTSAWAEASDVVVSYTPAVEPVVSVTASEGDDHVSIEVRNLEQAVTWSLERWQNITSPPDLVRLLNVAGVPAYEREREYVIVDNATPTGGTVTVEDHSVRAGLPYAYRAHAIHLGERRASSRWTSIIVSSP